MQLVLLFAGLAAASAASHAEELATTVSTLQAQLQEYGSMLDTMEPQHVDEQDRICYDALRDFVKDSRVCSEQLDVFRKFEASSKGDLELATEAFCIAEGCHQQMVDLVDTTYQACSTNPGWTLRRTLRGSGWLLRRSQHLLDVVCIRDSNDQLCYPEMKNLEAIGGSNGLTTAGLDAVCTECTALFVSAVTGSGDTDYEFGVWGKLGDLCIQHEGQYCAITYLEIEAEAALQTDAMPSLALLQKTCSPCANLYVARRVAQMELSGEAGGDALVNQLDYYQSELCIWVTDDSLCIAEVAANQIIQGNITDFATFKNRKGYVCAKTYANDNCYPATGYSRAAISCRGYLDNIIEEAGCCSRAALAQLGLTIVEISKTVTDYPVLTSTDPGYFVDWTYNECVLKSHLAPSSSYFAEGVPESCAQVHLATTLDFSNINFDYYLANQATIDDMLRDDLAFALGVHRGRIKLRSVTRKTNFVSQGASRFHTLADVAVGVSASYEIVCMSTADCATLQGSFAAQLAAGMQSPITATIPPEGLLDPSQPVSIATGESSVEDGVITDMSQLPAISSNEPTVAGSADDSSALIAVAVVAALAVVGLVGGGVMVWRKNKAAGSDPNSLEVAMV